MPVTWIGNKRVETPDEVAAEKPKKQEPAKAPEQPKEEE